MYLRFSPFEGSGVAVVAFDEFIDGMAQLSNTGEVGSLEGLAAQDAKPNLDLIEPRGVGETFCRLENNFSTIFSASCSHRARWPKNSQKVLRVFYGPDSQCEHSKPYHHSALAETTFLHCHPNLPAAPWTLSNSHTFRRMSSIAHSTILTRQPDRLASGEDDVVLRESEVRNFPAKIEPVKQCCHKKRKRLDDDKKR